jgi:tetratricopeptide (TPR) repeat protein
MVTAGTLDEGLANGRRLLEDHPQAALLQAETLLKLGPDPRALRLAAAAHRKLGDTKKAEAAEIVAIEAAVPNPLLKAAAEAEHEGRSGEASALAAQFLRQEPDDLLALTISAESGVSARRLSRAEEILRHVLSRAPQFMRAAIMLAKCLLLQSRLRDAIDVVEEVLKRKPNNGVALRLHARLLSDTRDYERVAAIYERLIALDDREIDLWMNYASTLRFMGRRQDAELALRRALAMHDVHGGAWWQIADLNPAAITDRDLAAIREALAQPSVDLIEATNLHFALGLALDQRGERGEAFDHFAKGNGGRLKVLPYEPATTTEEVDKSVEIFTPAYFVRYKRAVVRDSSPIFMVGMPRSGSTMVERIIGRHSRVEGAGELPIVPRLAEQLTGESGGPGRYREQLRRLPPERVKELGEFYLSRSRAFRRTDKPRFTDKLHMNWRHLGLIHLILPNARIIDVRRDPLDCCWSNFKTQFATGHPASNDLEHLGRFYGDYVRLMDHMKCVAPDSILQVRYEDIVDDIETQTRRMLDFLGLDFEAQCLDFHLSDEPVATASSEQVRRPLNREGIGVAQPYAQWLGPLREALGPLAEA